MYRYTVKVYEDTSLKTYHGITYGCSYTEALEHILGYFGEDDITELTLHFITDNKVLHCSDEIVNLIAKENDD